MVELGRTNGTKQLVSFSLKLQLLQVPVNLPFWQARMKKSREMELKLAKVRISLCPFFQTFLFSVRSIVSLRIYMSKIGDCRTSIGCNVAECVHEIGRNQKIEPPHFRFK